MKRPLFLPVILLLGACSISSDGDRPFDYPFDFSAEAQRMDSLNPLVAKTVRMDRGNEEAQTDTINWHKELAGFIKADINRPGMRNSYTESIAQVGDTQRISYTARETNLEVRQATYDYVGNTCVRVAIERQTESPVQTITQQLEYVPGVRYRIRHVQEVSLTFETVMDISGQLVSEQSQWLAVLNLGEEKLPFNFLYSPENDRMVILNAEERIEVTDITHRNDSIIARLPVFDSELRAAFRDSVMEGNWHHLSKGSDYVIPLVALKDMHYRFEVPETTQPADFSGKWEVTFSPGTEDAYKAAGVFVQEGTRITGTFLTETGDYRYLEGAVNGRQFSVSAFDGSHAFLFSASMDDRETLSGSFWSGNHWQEPWIAQRNPNFELADPNALTFLNEGYDRLEFSLPNLDSQLVSLDDPRFQGKVVIVEVMGSWCPNCKDASAFLNRLYDQYHDQGLEIIALAYERSEDFQAASRAVQKHRDEMESKFEYLVAG
ncbi:MAG: TlpA disulfide reductase family protein, partial [Bacteroidota bacterium]